METFVDIKSYKIVKSTLHSTEASKQVFPEHSIEMSLVQDFEKTLAKYDLQVDRILGKDGKNALTNLLSQHEMFSSQSHHISQGDKIIKNAARIVFHSVDYIEKYLGSLVSKLEEKSEDLAVHNDLKSIFVNTLKSTTESMISFVEDCYKHHNSQLESIKQLSSNGKFKDEDREVIVRMEEYLPLLCERYKTNVANIDPEKFIIGETNFEKEDNGLLIKTTQFVMFLKSRKRNSLFHSIKGLEGMLADFKEKAAKISALMDSKNAKIESLESLHTKVISQVQSRILTMEAESNAIASKKILTKDDLIASIDLELTQIIRSHASQVDSLNSEISRLKQRLSEKAGKLAILQSKSKVIEGFVDESTQLDLHNFGVNEPKDDIANFFDNPNVLIDSNNIFRLEFVNSIIGDFLSWKLTQDFRYFEEK